MLKTQPFSTFNKIPKAPIAYSFSPQNNITFAKFFHYKQSWENFRITDDKGQALMVWTLVTSLWRNAAIATGQIFLQNSTIQLIKENLIKKGDVLTTAEIAGIQAAKQTGMLIPLCHPLPLSDVEVATRIHEQSVEVTSKVITIWQTGVEMEALTAVSIALLTIYDMCKAVDKTMCMGNIHLVEKTKSSPDEKEVR